MGTLELLQNRAAISVRQSEIEEDRIVNVLIYERERLATGLYPVHMEPFKFEQILQGHRDIRVILHHQYGMRPSRFIHWPRLWTLLLSRA